MVFVNTSNFFLSTIILNRELGEQNLNTQMFQSVYIEPTAPKGQRVVFHTPMFETGTVGVSVLTSDRLVSKIGFVFSGPKEALVKFQEDVKEKDMHGAIGDLPEKAMVKKLFDLAGTASVSVHYKQFPVSEAKDTVNAEVFKILASVGELPSRSPSTVCMPPNISSDGELVWKAMFKGFRDDIDSQPPNGQWDAAINIYIGLCRKHSIDPFVAPKTIDIETLKDEVIFSLLKEEEDFQKTYGLLRSDIKSGRAVPTREFVGVKRLGGDVFLCTERKMPLAGLASVGQLCGKICEELKYYGLNHGHDGAIRQISSRGTVVVSGKQAGTLVFGLTIKMNEEEFRSLTNATDVVRLCRKNRF